MGGKRKNKPFGQEGGCNENELSENEAVKKRKTQVGTLSGSLLGCRHGVLTEKEGGGAKGEHQKKGQRRKQQRIYGDLQQTEE